MMGMAAHPRYEDYQDTGVEWLGTVPSAWAITRLGTVFTERRTKVSDKDYEPLSVTKNGILQQLDSAAKTNDGDNRKLVKKGDFVINSRSDRKGSSGVSPLDGSVSLINIVLQPKGIHPVFCNYVLKSYAFVEEYYRMGHGIVADLWTTRYDEMRGILMALPSPDEQSAIAAFLDDKCAKIDGAVKIKEDQIALLRERRQIIIQDAVTRGLNPAAPMKDSGIDWIGQIPTHWEVKKAAWYFSARKGSNAAELTKEYCGKFPGPFAVYSGQTENQGVLGRIETFEFDFRAHGCMLCSTVGAKAMTIRFLQEQFSLSQNCMIITAHEPAANMAFFSYSFTPIFAYFRNLIPDHMQASFRMEDFYQMKFLLPPVPEQTEILDFIRTAQTKIDDGIAIKEAQIAALKEYKTSLINAAVTGKIKVI